MHRQVRKCWCKIYFCGTFVMLAMYMPDTSYKSVDTDTGNTWKQLGNNNYDRHTVS